MTAGVDLYFFYFAVEVCMKRSFIRLLISLPLCASALAQTPMSTVPAVRLAHMLRGINASEWFAQVWDPKGYTREHFENWTTSADIALIKSHGFDYVRLSVNPQPFMDALSNQDGGAEYFSNLDRAIRMILDAGLAVDLDMHPDSDFKKRLSTDDSFVERFGDFWNTVARRYGNLSPDWLFFEILNEPEFTDPYRWYGVETKLAAAIRRGAPMHTILAPGARWDDDDDVTFLEPLQDPDVVYVFHFYESHTFTHQGATWGANYWRWLRGLEYPSSPENADHVATLVPDIKDRFPVVRYGQDHWGPARIEADIGLTADWAQEHHVALICNEFGVYRRYVDPRSRDAWLHDVRTILERHNIGWAMWDYSGSFGVVTKENGKTTVDQGVIAALGLK